MAQIVHNPEFNRQLPTVVYIHGYLGDGEFDFSVMAVRSAYRRKKNQNFIAIDWSVYSRFTIGIPYFSNVKKLQQVGKFIYFFLNVFKLKRYFQSDLRRYRSSTGTDPNTRLFMLQKHLFGRPFTWWTMCWLNWTTFKINFKQ